MTNNLSEYHERLHKGARRFHNEVFEANRASYEKAASEPQAPHTLLIACADSRVDPEALTQAGPGEVFVARNIGNVIPGYGEMLGGVSAVIEFAVLALNVKQIVVCGHTDCGAMKGLLRRQSVSTMPTVDLWLRNGEAALSVARAKAPEANDEEILTPLVKENILLQLNHLRTHPSVAGRVAEGTLALYGWLYDISNGLVSEYNQAVGGFEPIL